MMQTWPQQPQYKKVADVLRERILHGDYIVNEIPSLRRLASKMGVSHIVARKAVEVLIKDDLLVQYPNGRLMPKVPRHRAEREGLQVAFLAPAFDSQYMSMVRIGAQIVAAESRSLLRPMDYVHWNDLVIEEALNNFDGVILLASTEEIPPNVLDALSAAPTCLMTVDYDLTARGIPCLSLFRASNIRHLLDHLQSLGHCHVDCLNTQPICQETAARIEFWRQGTQERKMQGSLINDPVRSYERPIVRAYEVVSRRLEKGEKFGSAVFCPNESTANGAMRAFSEHGLEIGRDISVCAVGDFGGARYSTPSLTSLQMPDVATLLRPCFDWIKSKKRKWSGPLLVKPQETVLFIGESTGKAFSSDN